MRSNPKILLVDDDANLRKTLSDILKLKGYAVSAAVNGAAAIVEAQRAAVDVALIDLMLPDMSGIEVMERIRAASPRTEAIILTGHASLATAIEATSKGAYSYLLKPYEIEDLLLRIRHALDRQQAQEEIRRLASFPRLNPQPVIEIISSGEVTYTNPAADKLFPDLRLQDGQHPLLAGLEEVYAGFRQSGQTELVREVAIGASYYEEYLYYVPESDLIRLNVLDVTGRHQAAEVLRKANAELTLFRTLLDNSTDSIVVCDPVSLRYIDVNEKACNELGYSRNELLSMSVFDIDPGINQDTKKAIDAQMQKTGSLLFEGVMRRKNGTTFPVEINSKLVELDKPYVMSIVRDITDSKRTGDDLRIAATAFESHEGMLIADANNDILRVNNAFTTNTGYTSAEVVGKNPRMLSSGLQDANYYAAMWKSINDTGSWEGEIRNRRKNGEIYPELLHITAVCDKKGTVTNYVATLSDLTAINAATEKIRKLAFYDPLTGLPNRMLMIDRLHKAFNSSARSSREGAVLFIDLDHFKDINDTLGHDIGDLLLMQVAERLMACVREGDTVARLGGDEFVVLLEELSEQPLTAAIQAKAVGDKILAGFNLPYQLGTHEYHSTASIGISIFSDHVKTAEELLKRADIAMYQAKSAGRNSLKFFDPEMHAVISARVVLQSELRKALENRQFHLHYQIQVSSSHHFLGAEALIRWIHPERGTVSPAEFIPLAEDTGLILPIGLWVLETACAQIKAWEQNELTRDLILAVNVSARQFHQPDFADQVKAVVQHHAINPKMLKLELTESMLHENIEKVIATMSALKEIGIQFSLDDFGTGYSSLQYIKKLPLDQLKIDQSFVRDIVTDSSDKAIVNTIIAMAHSLNLDVIAEGVETEDQRQTLLDKGCTHYQGYLFGKPLPIEQFEAQLKQNSDIIPSPLQGEGEG